MPEREKKYFDIKFLQVSEGGSETRIAWQEEALALGQSSTAVQREGREKKPWASALAPANEVARRV